MTTKHVPATALPYLALTGQHSDEGRISYTGPNGHQLVLAHVFDGIDFASAPMNTDYLVHAANAYPKLVEALHDVLQWANIGVSECDQGGDDTEAAEALLRSLGEEA